MYNGVNVPMNYIVQDYNTVPLEYQLCRLNNMDLLIQGHHLKIPQYDQYGVWVFVHLFEYLKNTLVETRIMPQKFTRYRR